MFGIDVRNSDGHVAEVKPGGEFLLSWTHRVKECGFHHVVSGETIIDLGVKVILAGGRHVGHDKTGCRHCFTFPSGFDR